MIYEASLIFVSLISFALAIYAWTRPYRPTTTAYAAVALAQGLWSLYWAIDPMTPGLAQKLMLDHMAWLCGYVFVLLALRFALVYTGRSWSKRVWALFIVPAGFFVFASMTNETFHLMYASTHLVSAPPFTYLGVDYTPIAWAAYFYSYALIPIILWLLIRHVLDTHISFRANTALIIAGVAIPSLFSIVGLIFPQTTVSPAGSALNGVVYAAGTLLMAFGVFRVSAFRVMPIAHQFVFDRMSDAVIVVDSDQRIAELNPAARAFALGTHPLTGRSIAEAFPQLAEAFSGFALDGDLDSRFTAELNGESRVFDLQIRTIEDQRGKHRGRLGVIRDITEQVRMAELKVSEERLKVALQKERELNALKSKMMIRIAHEFRTPLSIIAINGETLDKYGDRMSDERRHQKLDEMQRRIQQLAQILDNIITVAQNEHDMPDSPCAIFDVTALCDQAATAEAITLAGSHQIVLETSTPPGLVRANRSHLATILNNLLTNAVGYSPDASVIHLRQWFEGDDLLLQVSDEGIGISAEDQERIFDPFFRGSNTDDISGMGLGLSIVRDFVSQMAGTIAVTSTPHHGATFTVRLPAVAATEDDRLDERQMMMAHLN